jgi:hypothetical protein
MPAGILPGFRCFCSPGLPPLPGDIVYVETGTAASLKLFVEMDGGWLTVQGWQDPIGGRQAPFTDRLAQGFVKRLAVVVYVKRRL